jgi:hypothetical protein
VEGDGGCWWSIVAAATPIARTPDRAGRQRPAQITPAVQSELGEANQRVVAVFGQRLHLRRVLVPTSVLVSGDRGVGDGRGT